MYSERGSNFEIRDGFKIRFHKNLSGGHTRWCCSVKSCSAYMKKNSLGDVTEEKRVQTSPLPRGAPWVTLNGLRGRNWATTGEGTFSIGTQSGNLFFGH